MILPLFVYKPDDESTKSVTRGLLTFFNKFNLQDAYFFYKQQPCLVSKFGTTFFDEPNNWNYFNATHYIVFYCISFNSPLSSYQFFYKTQNYPNEELIHLPLNFNTNSLVYTENAASIRTANNSFTKIFSIGNTIISPVIDGIPPETYSDASPAQVRDPISGTIVSNKHASNGLPYFLPNNLNSYQIVNTGETSKFVQQLIIYPLGFVESITIKVNTSTYLNQTRWALNNMRYLIMNNFKFFLIELPRHFELVPNEFVFTIEISPKTTAIDCIFLTKKPILGNEIVYGKTFSKNFGSGFYAKRSPRPGRIDFVNLPSITNELIISEEAIRSKYLQNEVAVVIFTGDMCCLGGNFAQGAPLLPNSTLQNVFSVPISEMRAAAATATTSSQVTVPTSFSNFKYTSEFVWLLSGEFSSSFNLTQSPGRIFAKMWDDHIVAGNTYKLPKLYMIQFGANVITSMPGTLNSFFNSTSTTTSDSWFVFYRYVAIICRMLKNQNLVPKLLFWHHDTNFSNALLYSQLNFDNNDYSLSHINVLQQFKEYLGALSSPQNIWPHFKNTLTSAADLLKMDAVQLEYATLAPRNSVILNKYTDYPGYVPSTTGQGIVYQNNQYYLPNFLNFMCSRYFNRVLQNTGDFLYERKNPFPLLVIEPPPPPPPPISLFSQGEEVELIVWLGDFLWNGTLENSNAGTPYLGSSNVLSWRADDPALTTNVPFGDPVPFTSLRNVYNLARHLNTTEIQYLGSNDHNTSPIAEFARKWDQRLNFGLSPGRRCVMIQFCATEMAHCIVGGASEPEGLPYAGFFSNEKYIAKFRQIVPKILEYFKSKQVRAGLRHVFYADHFSWTNAVLDNNFPFRQVASTKVDTCGIFHYQVYSVVEKLFGATRLNWTTYIHDIETGVIRARDGFRILYSDYDFLTRAYISSFLPFQYLINIITAGQFPRDVTQTANFFNLFEMSTGYTFKQDTAVYFSTLLEEILKPRYPIHWLSSPFTPARRDFQPDAPIILSGEFAPGVRGNYIQDTNKMCYLGRINFTNTTPIKLDSNITVPEDVWVPSDVPLLISIQMTNTTTTTGNLEQYDTDFVLFNVQTYARDTSFDFPIAVTNSLATNSLFNTFDFNPPRRWSIGLEFASLWNDAKNKDFTLPKLTMLHSNIGQRGRIFEANGDMFIDASNEPVGLQITNARNYIKSFIDYCKSQNKTVRIVGVCLELNTAGNLQVNRQEEAYGIFLLRFDKMMANLFGFSDYPLFSPGQFESGPGYITTAAGRIAFNSRMKQLENAFVNTRPNIYFQSLPELSNYQPSNAPFFNIYVITGNQPFRSMLTLETTKNLAKIFFNYNLKSQRVGEARNYFYNDNGARGSISSRRANYIKYDMDTFNNSKNWPDFLYTWDLYGNSAIYSTSELKTKNVTIYDNFYLEWSTQSVDSNFNFLVPIDSINVNQISTCRNRVSYRQGEISSQILNKNSLFLREQSPIWYSSNYMIASLVNFTSLTFPNFELLQNTENLDVKPNLNNNATVELINDQMRLFLLGSGPGQFRFSNEYLTTDNPFEVVFKMFLPSFSYTHYYQLKHVDFIQIALPIFGLETEFITINDNTTRVRTCLFTQFSNQYGITATIFPEFAYGTLYLYNSDYEDVQIILYSNAFKQFRSTILPSFIIKETGETYCRYLPLSNIDSFSVYVQAPSNFNLSNYLQKSKLFLFLAN